MTTLARRQLVKLAQAARRLGTRIDLGFIALMAMLYFGVTLLIAHAVRPDLDPVETPVYAHAASSHAAMVASGALVLGVGILALAVGLQPHVTGGRGSLGIALLGTSGVVATVFGALAEPAAAAPSAAHAIVAAAFAFTLVAGQLVLSHRFTQLASWKRSHRSALVLSLAACAALILSDAIGDSVTGLLQRLFLVVALMWLARVALELSTIELRAPS